MKPYKIFTRAASVAALLIVFCFPGPAQESRDRETIAPPSGLSLEIDTREGPVGYQSVPGQSFGGRYKRLTSWKPAEGATGPWTFEVEDLMEGDAVRVRVYAVMDRFRERRALIGDYLMREGQKVSVKRLVEFGYEPMELAIVKVKRGPLQPLETGTLAPSILPLSVEPRQTNFPSFKITLQNLSNKNITFLEVRTFAGGMLATKEWKRGEQNRPMIKAGATFDLIVDGGEIGLKDADGYTPFQPQRVEIAAAVFDDKSFEGELQAAAMFQAHLRGQKAQIKRALKLIETAGSPDTPSSIEGFKQQVLALGRAADESFMEEVSAEFPALSQRAKAGLKIHVEGGLNRIRKELLNDVEEYTGALSSGAQTKPFSEWMAGLRRKYESWLSRL